MISRPPLPKPRVPDAVDSMIRWPDRMTSVSRAADMARACDLIRDTVAMDDSARRELALIGLDPGEGLSGQHTERLRQFLRDVGM